MNDIQHVFIGRPTISIFCNELNSVLAFLGSFGDSTVLFPIDRQALFVVYVENRFYLLVVCHLQRIFCRRVPPVMESRLLIFSVLTRFVWWWQLSCTNVWKQQARYRPVAVISYVLCKGGRIRFCVACIHTYKALLEWHENLRLVDWYLGFWNRVIHSQTAKVFESWQGGKMRSFAFPFSLHVFKQQKLTPADPPPSWDCQLPSKSKSRQTRKKQRARTGDPPWLSEFWVEVLNTWIWGEPHAWWEGLQRGL